MSKPTSSVFDSYQAAGQTTTDDRHIYGDSSARFTLLLYSDLECPYCRAFHHTPKQVVDESGGLINWQWKHMPLPMHDPAAAIEAEAAECIADLGGNRAFWIFIEEVFQNTSGGGRGVGDIESLAGDVGIDRNAFISGVNSRRYEQNVATDIRQAQEMNVNSTPTSLMIDTMTGRHLRLEGSRPQSSFFEAVEELIRMN
ncbi:DsbA family protein [Parendozoicomonas haliclonae]|uniref:DSBA-like thioredoxin domain protein n=1 Tax=Parendozoicomonas haliclonae TaxID=1960125 RepID=A0A1X7AQY2_9GAMM|nr:thioredoxin domain-containing protein [Parendozoicomonas haliclonae]SMA50731.1 DSBA-like thioredoxin domain protein [Parendozoicomonas haliclonae]